MELYWKSPAPKMSKRFQEQSSALTLSARKRAAFQVLRRGSPFATLRASSFSLHLPSISFSLFLAGLSSLSLRTLSRRSRPPFLPPPPHLPSHHQRSLSSPPGFPSGLFPPQCPLFSLPPLGPHFFVCLLLTSPCSPTSPCPPRQPPPPASPQCLGVSPHTSSVLHIPLLHLTTTPGVLGSPTSRSPTQPSRCASQPPPALRQPGSISSREPCRGVAVLGQRGLTAPLPPGSSWPSSPRPVKSNGRRQPFQADKMSWGEGRGRATRGDRPWRWQRSLAARRAPAPASLFSAPALALPSLPPAAPAAEGHARPPSPRGPLAPPRFPSGSPFPPSPLSPPQAAPAAAPGPGPSPFPSRVRGGPARREGDGERRRGPEPGAAGRQRGGDICRGGGEGREGGRKGREGGRPARAEARRQVAG